MIITNRIILLAGFIFCLYSPSLQAQKTQYSKDQIIGKWILKSATFNKEIVSFANEANWMSFEFVLEGKVILQYADGKVENGDFLVSENKLIDPNAPEFLDADILSLSKNGLVLAMGEDKNRVLMTFELEVVE